MFTQLEEQNNMKRFFAIIISALLLATVATMPVSAKSPKLKALIVSGQNNHNWPVSHKALKLILDNSGLFTADIVLTAKAGGDMSQFRPDFDKYDVVVLDYNGDRWPAETDAAFLRYVQNGGGVVVYHAADNAFAFNCIITPSPKFTGAFVILILARLPSPNTRLLPAGIFIA